jgi:hypothetical protein
MGASRSGQAKVRSALPGCEIVICTPGRMLDLLDGRKTNLRRVICATPSRSPCTQTNQPTDRAPPHLPACFVTFVGLPAELARAPADLVMDEVDRCGPFLRQQPDGVFTRIHVSHKRHAILTSTRVLLLR